MIPTDVRLEPHTSGDTWQGIPEIGPIVDEVTDAVRGGSIVSAELWLYLGDSTTPFKLATAEATGEDAPINVVGDGSTWELTVPPVAAATFPAGVGEWHGKLKIVDSTGEKLTYYNVTFPAMPER